MTMYEGLNNSNLLIEKVASEFISRSLVIIINIHW